jgi:hypothetical protein
MNGLTPIDCLNRMALQTFVLKGKENATWSKYGYGTCTDTEYGILKKCNGHGTLSQNGVSSIHASYRNCIKYKSKSVNGVANTTYSRSHYTIILYMIFIYDMMNKKTLY